MFFPGTIKDNLDIFSSNTVEMIEAGATRTGIWPLICAKGGLGAAMSADTWSAGEKQLFCLTRALLRRPCGVLLIDELSGR